MKLYAKIFLGAMAVISIALSVTGYLLISTSFENAMVREKERVLDRYQLVKFSIQASMLTSDIDWEDGEQIARLSVFENMYSNDENNKLGIFSENRKTAYTELPAELDLTILEEVDEQNLLYCNQNAGNIHYMVVAGQLTQDEQTVYLVVSTDITDIVDDKDQMEASFKATFGITLGICMVLLLILTTIITRPIKKLSQATASIASGNYSERTNIQALDEIGELGDRFDHMAEVIEDKIQALEQGAQQKEEFIGNFAHELKTPLTSIIGYADMMYQKELSTDGVKSAAGYILKEGLRLEALSNKMMDLVVVNQHNFMFESLPVAQLFEDISMTVKPLLEKNSIKFQISAEDAYISVEYDLFKSMMLNFIDNAVKADSSSIILSGVKEENSYVIQIRDNGRGMEEAELERITEAFYMIDKSRARSQNGAGLGLALASRIAEIHKGEIQFESVVGGGTTVTLRLMVSRGTDYE